MIIAAVGVVVSIVATFFVKTKEGGNPQHALDFGAFGAAGLMAILTYFIIGQFCTDLPLATRRSRPGIWIANAIGLGVGVCVGLITNYLRPRHEG